MKILPNFTLSALALSQNFNYTGLQNEYLIAKVHVSEKKYYLWSFRN